MQDFRTNLTVDIHDVDFNGVARTSALMKYIQSAAQTQLTENGLSYDILRQKNKAFILSRIKLEFTESPRAYEPLTAITFPCNSRGYSFLRCHADGSVNTAYFPENEKRNLRALLLDGICHYFCGQCGNFIGCAFLQAFTCEFCVNSTL